METWFRRIFLALTLISLGSLALAQEQTDSDAQDKASLDEEAQVELTGQKTRQKRQEASVLDAVISPDLKRRKVKEDKIDSENFELGAFAGVMSVEDFGTNNLFGARFSYHINQDLFVDFTYAQTETGRTSFEVLSGANLLTSEQREMIYYNASLGINLLPGEIFMGRKYAFNANFYLTGGLGSTEWAGNDYFTYNFGGGVRIFMTDSIAARIDFRNHLFTHQVLGAEKSIQNLETHMGLSLFF